MERLRLVKTGFASILLGIVLVVPADASTIVFSNGLPNGVSGLNITSFAIYDDFTFTETTTFDGIRFWNVQNGSFSNAGFGWQVLDDLGGLPGAVIGSGTTAALRTAQGFGCCSLDRFQNELSVGSLTLATGTYWLRLIDTSLSPMFWETTDPNGSYQALGGPAGFQLAFELTNSEAVPEPTTLVLLGSAAVGAILRRRSLAA